MASQIPKSKFAIGDNVIFTHKRIKGSVFNSAFLYHMDEHIYLVADSEGILHEVRESNLVTDEGTPSVDCSIPGQIT